MSCELATVTGPLFTLLAASAVLVSCIFPWRTWPAELWSRPSLRAAGVTVATLYPLGFYLFVRAYELGDGRYPHVLFNVALAAIGIAAAFAAAARAQAAPTRRRFLGELVPGMGGFALAAIAMGTPLGLVAGLILLATASLLIAGLALLPDHAGIASLVTIAAAVGLPPGIAFGARAIGLPAGRGHPAAETFPRVSLLIALVTLAAGPAIAAVKVAYADPVAAEVMPSAGGALAGGLLNVVTVSSVLPAITLLVPLLVFGAAAYAVSGTRAIRTQSRPAAFEVPAAVIAARVSEGLRSATVPEQYRTLLNLRGLEVAAAGGRPVLWLGALIALGFAVTR